MRRQKPAAKGHRALIDDLAFLVDDEFFVTGMGEELSDRISELRETVTDHESAAISGAAGYLESERELLRRAEADIDSLSPLKILSRGYSYVSMDGKNVRSIAGVAAGDRIKVTFSDGAALCSVEEVCSNEQ